MQTLAWLTQKDFGFMKFSEGGLKIKIAPENLGELICR